MPGFLEPGFISRKRALNHSTVSVSTPRKPLDGARKRAAGRGAPIFLSVKWEREGGDQGPPVLCYLVSTPTLLHSGPAQPHVPSQELAPERQAQFPPQTTDSQGEAGFIFMPLPNPQRNKAKPRNSNSKEGSK